MQIRLTDRSLRVMKLASQEARGLGHRYIGSEHLLLGLLKEGHGVGAVTLKNLGINLRKVRFEVGKIASCGPGKPAMEKPRQKRRVRRLVGYAMSESTRRGHHYVGTEHPLLGLLREPHGGALRVLVRLGSKSEEIRSEVLALLGQKGCRQELRSIHGAEW